MEQTLGKQKTGIKSWSRAYASSTMELINSWSLSLSQPAVTRLSFILLLVSVSCVWIFSASRWWIEKFSIAQFWRLDFYLHLKQRRASRPITGVVPESITNPSCKALFESHSDQVGKKQIILNRQKGMMFSQMPQWARDCIIDHEINHLKCKKTTLFWTCIIVWRSCWYYDKTCLCQRSDLESPLTRHFRVVALLKPDNKTECPIFVTKRRPYRAGPRRRGLTTNW